MQWGQKSLEIALQILIIYKSLEASYTGLKSLRKEATPSATNISKGLTELAIILDYKRP